ncbi:DUF1489 family protein [Phenylobacterium montanum]|uniref:DUF1489 domain-containing protein n=1 Tax=Phenylobacterium montanum TaxID=2823693 RepID=A0A975IVD1_9CAUL|nr:DUF1489 domain-containing protein [Caulobacter sp. S6]QUD88454.1 DUF1489 domain-containing protein [Caulobacter sp. S6]
MTLHLIKLCVGADSVEELRAWRERRKAEGHRPIVPTRQTPKRAADILEGGSLYWVIKGQVLVRQKILAIDTLESGTQPCRILLDEPLILTAPQPRRAFQGWRYFEAKDAPPDLANDATAEAMPQELAARLREIGAW